MGKYDTQRTKIEDYLNSWFDAKASGDNTGADLIAVKILSEGLMSDGDLNNITSNWTGQSADSWASYSEQYADYIVNSIISSEIQDQIAEQEDFWTAEGALGAEAIKLYEDLTDAFNNTDDPLLKAALEAQLNLLAPDGALASNLGLALFGDNDLNLVDLQEGRINQWDYTDPAENAVRFRWASQCALASIIDGLAEIHPAMLQEDKPYQNIHLVGGASGDLGQSRLLMNKLSAKTDVSEFLNLKPHEISQLYPKIEIYKVVYEQSEDGKNKFLDEIRLPFPAHSIFNSESDILESSRTDFGISGVQWAFQGAQPAVVDKDIVATITFYFQGFDSLISPHVDFGKRGNQITWNYLDLLGFGASSASDLVYNKSRIYDDPRFYEIRLVAGYNIVNSFLNDELSAERRSKIMKAVKAQQSDIYLTLNDHTINVQQDGTIQISCQFRGRLGGLLTDPKLDVLANGELKAKMLEINAKEEEIKKEKNKEKQESLRKEVQILIDNYSFKRLKSIIRRLEFKNRIYNIQITNEQLGQFATTGLLSSDVSELLPKPEAYHYTGYSEDLEDTVAAAALEYRYTNEEGQEVVDASLAAEISLGNDQGAPVSTIDSREDAVKRLTHVVPKEYEQGSFSVPFIYFGDLIDVATDIAFEQEVSDLVSSAGGTPERVSFELDVLSKIKIILGPFEYEKVICGLPKSINLASVPISMDLFTEFFYQHVMTTAHNIPSLPLGMFIRQVLSELIIPALGDRCRGQNRAGNITVRAFPVQAPAKSGGGDPMLALLERQKAEIEHVDNRNVLRIHFLNPLDEDDNKSLMSLETLSSDSNSMYRYITVYTEQEVQSSLSGNPEVDKFNGIHHLYIGRNRGLLQEVQFQKTEIPFLKEARLQMVSDNPHYQLSNKYDANIKMYGNNLFIPGTYLYLNPLGLGASLGDPSSRRSVSRGMGLGGYHLVTNITHNIQGGTYTTTVTALWESSGGGRRYCEDQE